MSHWTCDETSGTRYDSNTVNSYDLTDNNTVGYQTGARNNACDFESTADEYLSRTNASATNLNLTSNFSVSFWMKPETSFSSLAYSPGIIAKGGASTGYVIAGNWTVDKVSWIRHDAATSISSDTTTSGNWYHIVITYDGSKLTSYQNGVKIATSTYSIHTAATTDFNIGRSTVYTTRDYDGLLDEITIFSTALSDAQVTALYNSGVPLPYLPTTESSTSSTSTVSFNDGNIVYALSIIIGFLTMMFLGYIWSIFKRK